MCVCVCVKSTRSADSGRRRKKKNQSSKIHLPLGAENVSENVLLLFFFSALVF